MLISPALVSKFLSDPDEPDYYQAARVVLNLFKHEMSPKNTWARLVGEQGTVIHHAQCQRQGCARDLFVCKLNISSNPIFLKNIGIKGGSDQPVYHLIQQDHGREQTLCTFGYGRTDRRYKQASKIFTYVSIGTLLKGRHNITIDENYLCGRFNILK